MSLMSVAMLTAGILLGMVLFNLLTSLKLKNLRTVPKPQELSPEMIKLFPAETRAGIQLHQACFDNDPKAANDALTMWAWANGESAVANCLDQKMSALQHQEFRKAIKALWLHLDSKNNKQWFGDPLWNAFLITNPEFQDMEIQA